MNDLRCEAGCIENKLDITSRVHVAMATYKLLSTGVEKKEGKAYEPD